MTVAKAGRLVNPGDAVDTVLDTFVSDSAVGSIGANFTLVDAQVRALLDLHLVFFSLAVTTTNALTASSGNIADVSCFTLDTEYRPSDPVASAFGSSVTGFAVLNTNGTVGLWTASDTVAAGSTLRMSFTFLRP